MVFIQLCLNSTLFNSTVLVSTTEVTAPVDHDLIIEISAVEIILNFFVVICSYRGHLMLFLLNKGYITENRVANLHLIE